MSEYYAVSGFAQCNKCRKGFMYIKPQGIAPKDIMCPSCGYDVCKDGVWSKEIFHDVIIPPSNIRTIAWQSYPACKPKEPGYYLITEVKGKDKVTTTAFWRGEEWSFNPYVSAWAEFPSPDIGAGI